VRRADDQWWKAVCAGASVLRPRGTGLGVGSESRPVGTKCSRSPASERWSQAHSGVRARRYSGEADVACLSGILPGYSCKEGRRRTPTRIPL
jgi:hypothetical protein